MILVTQGDGDGDGNAGGGANRVVALIDRIQNERNCGQLFSSNENMLEIIYSSLIFSFALNFSIPVYCASIMNVIVHLLNIYNEYVF